MVSARATWLSVAPCPPRKWDLRLLDWHILPQFRAALVDRAVRVILDWRIGFRCSDWLDLRSKHRALVVGVETPGERARLLQLGFGAVLHCDTPLDELAARLAGMRSRVGLGPRPYKPQIFDDNEDLSTLDLPSMVTHTGEASQPGILVRHETYRPCHC